MRRSAIASTLTLVLALACAGRGGADELDAKARPPIGDPVQPGVWRIHGTDPALPSSDLQPLKTLIGRASVVGLGESIHTSGGFYEMKGRLIRYLVAEAGFRVVAWETPWVGADELATYVETCSGDLDGAMRKIFGVWSSDETRSLFAWMCDWNRAHRRKQDKVHFMGFDVQGFYGQAAANAAYLRSFLGQVGIPADDGRLAALDDCDSVVATEPIGHLTPERVARCLQATDELRDLFAQQGTAFARKTSKSAFALAQIHLTGLRAWEDQARSPFTDVLSFNARDAAMASTLVGLRSLRYPNAKTIVWAHNLHLSRGNTDLLSAGTVWMGSHLARTLGKAYYTVGLGSADTEIDWPNTGCGRWQDYGREGSVERALADFGQGDLLLDLQQPGVLPGIIPEGRPLWGGARMLLDREFDALLYLDRSPKMIPLLWSPCE